MYRNWVHQPTNGNDFCIAVYDDYNVEEFVAVDVDVVVALSLSPSGSSTVPGFIDWK